MGLFGKKKNKEGAGEVPVPSLEERHPPYFFKTIDGVKSHIATLLGVPLESVMQEISKISEGKEEVIPPQSLSSKPLLYKDKKFYAQPVKRGEEFGFHLWRPNESGYEKVRM